MMETCEVLALLHHFDRRMKQTAIKASL